MKKSSRLRRRGQIMTEYWIMAVICLVVLGATISVLGFISEYGWRILALISLDYP